MLLETKFPKRNLISITPLIDVVFILLLFFMLSSTFTKTRQLEFNASTQLISDRSSVGNLHEVELVKIIVLDGQHILLDGQRLILDSDAVAAKFANFTNKDQSIVVAASSNTDVQSLISVLDFMTGAGVRKLSLSPSVEARFDW